MSTHISEDHLLQLGLEFAGFINKTCRKTAVANFRACYGIDPSTGSTVFDDIQSPQLDSKIKNPNPFYFLMTLYWMSGYATVTRLCGLFKVHAQTFRKQAWMYLKSMQALKSLKIRWHYDDDGRHHHADIVLIATVDGVHCPINEPRKEPSSTWYSHKVNGPALGYELAVDVHSNQLVWINGPFPAGENDITVFRKPDGLKGKIPPGKKVVADRGYRGEPDKVSVPNTHDSLIVSNYKKRARARHETFNQRIKSFNMMKEPFRHGVENHKIAFEAICVLVQYDIESDHPLFQI